MRKSTSERVCRHAIEQVKFDSHTAADDERPSVAPQLVLAGPLVVHEAEGALAQRLLSRARLAPERLLASPLVLYEDQRRVPHGALFSYLSFEKVQQLAGRARRREARDALFDRALAAHELFSFRAPASPDHV